MSGVPKITVSHKFTVILSVNALQELHCRAGCLLPALRRIFSHFTFCFLQKLQIRPQSNDCGLICVIGVFVPVLLVLLLGPAQNGMAGGSHFIQTADRRLGGGIQQCVRILVGGNGQLVEQSRNLLQGFF